MKYKFYIFTSENIKLIFSLLWAVKNIRSGSTFILFTLMFSLHEMKIFMVFTEKEYIFFLFYFYKPILVSDVISNVTKQNKTWTSWRQGTKLRVRLSLAKARFASLLSKVTYIIKRKFKCLSWIWLLFHLVKWKNVYFIRAFGTHEIYIFFTSLGEIKVIFTPNIWISSIYILFNVCWEFHTMSSMWRFNIFIKT